MTRSVAAAVALAVLLLAALGSWAGAVVVLAEPDAPASAPPPFVTGGSEELVLRVGLDTDLARVVVPCCDRLSVDHGGERRTVEGELVITPGGQARTPTFRLQVAALKDEDQAAALAANLERSGGAPARATFDVASGLYRVRLGRWDSREAAERARQRLSDHGLGSSWVVQEGGGLERAALVLASGGRSAELPGRWLAIEPPAGGGILLERGRFRGRVLVFLNDRGLLNVVNELSIEDYLRGVVPQEMGPEQYDSIEALKAQAVAARTFAARSLGGFALEGFDLCASPRCQAYGGMRAEHPLSDRAVGETRGEIVLHDGAVAEALYSASCGGATEDVQVVFPKKSGAYLRGIACPERGVVRLGAAAAGAPTYARAVLDAVAPSSSLERRAGRPAIAQERLEALLARSGVPAPTDALASLHRDEVRRYLASILDLRLDPRVLGEPLAQADALWSPAERRLHARFAGREPAAEVSASEMEDIALDVARVLDLVIERRAYFVEPAAGSLIVREGPLRRTVALAPAVATFALRAGRLVPAALDLAPGDRLLLTWSGERLVAVAGDHDGHAEPPRPSAPWTVWRAESDLRRTVATLYPGFALRDFEVVARGASGRIGKLRLLGQGADTVVLEGIAVRWTMGTPETWFEARRETRGGERGWVLAGRGRGHGVGLCQIGAVAMARRGHTYREILAHYYGGAKLGLLRVHAAELETAVGTMTAPIPESSDAVDSGLARGRAPSVPAAAPRSGSEASA